MWGCPGFAWPNWGGSKHKILLNLWYVCTFNNSYALFCLFYRWFKNGESKWIARNGSKGELIGETLEAEDLPLDHTVKRNDKNLTVIKKTACAYVKDLKESILAYVEDSARYNFFCSWSLAAFQSFPKYKPTILVWTLYFSTEHLTWQDGHIWENLLYVKLGGNHGQGSMKLEFQLGNVVKPNSSKRTVVFAIFEAKDTRNNLRAIAANYKGQVEDLLQTTWQ